MTLSRWLVFLAAPVLLGTAWADPGPAAPPDGQVAQASYAQANTASGGSSSGGSGIGWQGWGLRVGVADDPDQVVGGAHFNLGEFVNNLRFQPDVQLGLGDDYTTLYGTAPVYYRFDVDTSFTPYAGGGVSVGWVDVDGGPGNNNDSEFEVGGKATGGLEWPMSSGRAFFVELSIGFGDIHDVTLIGGWSF